MSYVETRVLLQRLLEQHNEFISWVKFQAEGLGDNPLHVVAARIADDAVVRRDAVRDVLERSDANALATQIQYENRGAPDLAIKELPKEVITEPDGLIGAASGFWRSVLDELDLLAREATNSGAEAIYKQLATETENVVASEAWSARPE